MRKKTKLAHSGCRFGEKSRPLKRNDDDHPDDDDDDDDEKNVKE